MQTIAISAAADAADRGLRPALEAAGLLLAEAGRGPRVFAAAERPEAGPRDLLVECAPGAPAFRPAANGRPALVRYGQADAPFARALVAELLRAPHRPAAADPASRRLLALAERAAAADATVLVLGETGTGKEGLARFVHAASPRAAKPFVAVNCAAIPETMLEATLFGHAKGSFTGAGAAAEGLFRAADGGTLLLDEIAEMPLALQAKLLRALQEREVLPVGATRAIPVDVRIVAAANRDLAAEVAAGRFRADLYWRLNVVPLTLRPLAERPADLLAIVAALLVRHGAADAWPTSAALARLSAHAWPGNVRELDNVVQRALLFRAGERLEAEDFPLAPALRIVETAAPAPAATPVSRLADAARSTATRAIAEALAATGGNRVRAAGLLGISERTLRYRLAGIRAASDQLAAA